MRRSAVFWDEQYKEKKYLWGREPSELAKVVSQYLRENMADRKLKVLDIGCGYGRDAIFLSKEHNCIVLGIDISGEAIDIASKAVPESLRQRLEFRQYDFKEFFGDGFDIVFSSSLYQLLGEDDRRQFVRTVLRVLQPNGMLFLSTLSANDPEHGKKAVPIPDETNSYQDVVYLHLCSRDELQHDFAALQIRELFEHEFNEPRVTGETHHHISWILIAEYRSKQSRRE
jgi:cyclopropane fatty-acyl-phospholipid synthase-like methyltransferase